MAKIGTAQIEIKPVLNEEALDALVARIEQRVREAVLRGLAVSSPPVTVTTTPHIVVQPGGSTWTGGVGKMRS